MRYSVSIPCAVPCAYKDSLYAWSQVDIPGSFQAMPGAASIISNILEHTRQCNVCRKFYVDDFVQISLHSSHYVYECNRIHEIHNPTKHRIGVRSNNEEFRREG